MKKSAQILRIFVIILAIILFGIGLYLNFTTSRNLYTAIFLRAGFIFGMFACLWKQVLRLPRWTDIGWLPVIAVLIAWKLFLLKFAIPVSVILMFLNSPICRKKFKPKSWRHLREKTHREASQESKPQTESKPEYPVKPESEFQAEPKSEPKSEQRNEPKSKPQNREKNSSRSEIRGPNAKNVMFRAFSRVAGRQVGKLMSSEKKKS